MRRIGRIDSTLDEAIHHQLLMRINVGWKIPATADGTILDFEQRTVSFVGPEWNDFLHRASVVAADAATEWATHSAAARCPRCDHLPAMHQAGGCWYTVTTGTTPGENLMCPCIVPHAEGIR